jgi:carboxymethylenebutenolidase
VLVIHEWWGLNDHIRTMARRLADAGYLALAVDLYEGEVAEDRDTARKLVTRAREQTERGEENLSQALAYLRAELGAEKVGVIGWCFGGGWSLATALNEPDGIDATVIYYGRLVTDEAELAVLDSPILGIFGALDEGIPVATVREFEAALDSLGKEASIHVYEGANHAFANPTGTRYQAEAAADAWARTLAFFAEHLG